ncbi:zinc finger CCCH-type with G patch domain-containing protein [Drosophila guanche]|uniref:Zinc finger CCCH-type with G patch domain-containing protein n=1 Tax=Drosophila guanche TaxID=7266 RepID=A0A3B0JX36_DROGU|nr:zinc finger CCCH-type with G patch domain-containing protein [Drosophila guanche]SPP85633.1 blast:Zinc finger CCCH-type with G patch domain-containing protein [Drosophila guanche]
MNEYEAQLVAVEQALKNATDEQQREELSALRTNLQELLALTRETEADQTAQHGDILDDELLRLKSELNELEEAAANVGPKNEDEEQQLADLRAKYNALIGEKCSAPHEHSWGAVSYHNALICGVDDEVIINSNAVLDVRLRVLYINPTHCEMLPCNYYLEGECRFDEIRCRYSHGALVPGASIKSYIPPDFPRLARNCPVLAKMPDRLWHRGRVLCANFVEQTCRVRLDGQDHKERERDFQFEELYPLIAEEEDGMTSEDSTSSQQDGSSDEIESDMDDLEAAHRSRMVELSLFTFKPTEKLGAWEQYTRGIGSKLMEKMGYIHGTGLGSEGRGIVTPVSAQILPQGRSLDACMELREAANGDKDYFSVERKLKRAQRRQNKANEKAYVRETQRTDVFSFLNGSVLGGSGKSGQQAEQAAKNTKASDLQQHSTKTLNVETVRVADDIRRKQRDIAKVKQSLDRNATDVQLQKRLHMQLQSQKQELATLQAHEHRLSKEQNTRKNKMFEF